MYRPGRHCPPELRRVIFCQRQSDGDIAVANDFSSFVFHSDGQWHAPVATDGQVAGIAAKASWVAGPAGAVE